MKQTRLLTRSLIYYWRTNLAILAGVAIAVAVLSGALLVGQSVRGSLRRLLYERIGATDTIITADRFFRERLADAYTSAGERCCPIIYIKGVAVHEQSNVRIHDVHIYGVDERFWKLQGQEAQKTPESRFALVGNALAQKLGAHPGDALLLRIETHSGVPSESLYGRRDDLGKTLRLTCQAILPDSKLGEFALRPSQGNVYSVFLPLKQLQKDLGLGAQINTILFAQNIRTDRIQSLRQVLKKNIELQDLGLKLRPFPSENGFSLESDRILLDDSIARSISDSAREIGAKISPLYSYLANSIRGNNREIPYSVITAADIGENALESIPKVENSPGSDSQESIWLTGWAGRDLGVVPGDFIEIDYYIWMEEGKLTTLTARFRLSGMVPLNSGVDTTFAPEIPGVTNARSMNSWDPPFPLDLSKIRNQDEEYWNQHRAAPKAFISLARGQELWQNRFGKLTAIRVSTPVGAMKGIQKKLLASFFVRLDPEQAGFSILPVKEQGLDAARGSTDFGEYFVYFSSFLIAAAILLSLLFFKLMIEQRVQEIGVLRAAGFSLSFLRRIFLCEGLILSISGSLLGLFGSMIYGWLMIFGLRTLWVDAVGTRRLDLYLSWPSFAIGAAGGILISLGAIAWTLRNLNCNSPRSAMAGVLESEPTVRRRARVLGVFSISTFILSLLLLIGAATENISQLEGFFGAGFMLLMTFLGAGGLYLRRSRPHPIRGSGYPAYLRFAIRNAMYRPGRSLVCAALIASATFVIVSMEAFRQNSQNVSSSAQSGSGGYPLIAESSLPIIHDLNSSEGREALGISPDMPDITKTRFVSFRERPGEDASCLNLYKSQEPTILGAPEAFLSEERFSFQKSMPSGPKQKLNPWLLLQSPLQDGAIPAIADANTIQYSLHLSVGQDLILGGRKGHPVRLRLVAALKDSIFQGKILISDSNFLKAFPEQEGRRFFLLEPPGDQAASLIRPLQETLADWGFSIELSSERLSAFHRVENAYLSTFQSLGSLGLFLGTIGLAAVLLRNVFERRRELALLRAVGYRRKILTFAILAENALLIIWGLATGAVCALLAVTPAMLERGSAFPIATIGRVLFTVLIIGLAASFLAVIAAFRSPLLTSLHSE